MIKRKWLFLPEISSLYQPVTSDKWEVHWSAITVSIPASAGAKRAVSTDQQKDIRNTAWYYQLLLIKENKERAIFQGNGTISAKNLHRAVINTNEYFVCTCR